MTADELIKKAMEIAEIANNEYDQRTDCTGHFEYFYDKGYCDGMDDMVKALEKALKGG